MSDATDLERRYRRLLRLYPRRFRAEREEEMLPVLMQGAKPGQRRPSLAECADLLKSATWTRLRNPTAWEEDHAPRLWVGVRVISGLWLIILTAILCHYGYWWGLALLAPAALHFYLAVRLGRFVEQQAQPPHGPSPKLPTQ